MFWSGKRYNSASIERSWSKIQPTNIKTTFNRETSIWPSSMGSSYSWYGLGSSHFLRRGYCTSESTETVCVEFAREEKSGPNSGFGRIYCFRENLNVDLLCTIYKRCLLPTAKDQFEWKSTDWKLQEDNDPKHTSKLANQRKSKYRIQRLHWPSISPDLNPIENVWKLLKMNLARKKSSNVQVISCSNQERMEKLSNRSGNKSGAKYEKSYFWCYC